MPGVWEGRVKCSWGWTSAWRLQVKPSGHANSQQGQALLPSHQPPQAASPPASSRKVPEGRARRLDQESNRGAAVWVRQLATSPSHADLEATSPQTEEGFISLSVPCPLPPFPCSMPRHTTQGRQDSTMPSNDLGPV